MACSLEDLYKSYKSRLTAFAASRIPDPDSADDLVHDMFVKVAGYCNRGGDCSSPKSFLYRATTNVITDYFRRRKEKRDVRLPAAGSADGAADQQFLQCLSLLIDQLPEPYREAVRLADIDQLPQQEIARRAGISLSGAKSRIQRGRLKLRDIILRLCDIEYDCYGSVTHCSSRR